MNHTYILANYRVIALLFILDGAWLKTLWYGIWQNFSCSL